MSVIRWSLGIIYNAKMDDRKQVLRMNIHWRLTPLIDIRHRSSILSTSTLHKSALKIEQLCQAWWRRKVNFVYTGVSIHWTGLLPWLKLLLVSLTLLPLILGFDVMLLCMHLHMAALHATATCWYPELSVLSYAPYAINWSLDYTDHAHLVSFLQQWQ